MYIDPWIKDIIYIDMDSFATIITLHYTRKIWVQGFMLISHYRQYGCIIETKIVQKITGRRIRRITILVFAIIMPIEYTITLTLIDLIILIQIPTYYSTCII